MAQELEQETLEEQAENNTDNEILDELDEVLYGANPEVERRSGDDDYIKVGAKRHCVRWRIYLNLF